MEIYIYKNFKEFNEDTPSIVLEGDIKQIQNGYFAIDTMEEYKTYRQYLSLSKIFAIAYKLPYGFLGYSREINFFEHFASWNNSSPELTLQGEIQEDECTSNHLCFISNEGYKEYVSLKELFAITYER